MASIATITYKEIASNINWIKHEFLKYKDQNV